MEEEVEEVISENDKGKFLKQGHVSLILESYNDIFSGFDPRPFSERALSDDFLLECKKASVESKEFDLRLLIAKEKRNVSAEIKIKKRLKEHFIKHYHEKQKELRGLKTEGIIWFILGAVDLTVASLIYNYSGFVVNFLKTMMEPAGWFMFWEGLGKVFIIARERKPDFDFYKKLAHSEIEFFSY